MSKIFNIYTKNADGIDVDRTWYDSSNVKYTECIDKDNELKTLKVVFSNGSQYQYDKVDVSKYLLLREDSSQGKALNKYIKSEGYEYKKIEDANIDELTKELNDRLAGAVFVSYKDGRLVVKDNTDMAVFVKEIELSDDILNVISGVLVSVGKLVYLNGKKL